MRLSQSEKLGGGGGPVADPSSSSPEACCCSSSDSWYSSSSLLIRACLALAASVEAVRLVRFAMRFGFVSGSANSRMSSGMEEERDGPSWGTQSDLGHCTDWQLRDCAPILGDGDQI